MATFSVQKLGKRLSFGTQRPLYAAFLGGLNEGNWYDVTITKKKHPKTTPQLNYWWGVVVPTAMAALDEATGGDFGELACGEFRVPLAVTAERVHEFLKALYAVHIGETKRLSLAKMTDEEASPMIDFACKFLATNLGAIVPEALEKEWQTTTR